MLTPKYPPQDTPAPPAIQPRIEHRPATLDHHQETFMEKMLHQLESFNTRGSDGNIYVVRGYEHLARLDAVRDVQGQWEPTGEAEYKLEDGRPVVVDADGMMTIPDSGIRLKRVERADIATAR